MENFVWLRYDSYLPLAMVSCSSFQSKLSLLRVLLKIWKTFSHNLHICIYRSLFSTASNFHIVDTGYPQRICSHTFVVDEFFKIIFTSFYCFNQRFKIWINNRVCIIRFLVLINPYYLSVFKQHHNTTQSFIFTNVFLRFKFALCSKQMNTIQKYKSPCFFKIIVLDNVGSFLMQCNVSFSAWNHWNNNLFSMIWVLFWNVGRNYILLF